MGAKGGGEKVVTQQLDPLTERYREEIFNRARDASMQPYTGNPANTVAGANPLTGEAVTGWRAAGGDLARLGDFSEGLFHRSNQMGQDYANQFNAVAGDYGRMSQDLQGTASGFDQLAGRMRGIGDRYTGMVGDMSQFGDRFGDYLSTGQYGAQALGGDQAALSRFMNPYTSQVLDATASQYDKARSQASLEAEDAAAKAGAFGGSRHGIMEGARLGELDQGQMATMAGLRAQGFNEAMGRAGQAANLGFGAGEMDLAGRRLGATFGGLGLSAEQVGQGYNNIGVDARRLGQGYDQMGLNARGMGADASLGAYNLGMGALGQAGQFASARGALNNNIFNAGDYYRQIEQAKLDDADRRFREQRDWDVRNLGILQSGLSGVPYGSSTSEPLYRNYGAGALGGAAQGAAIGSVIPGVGTAIGAGVGGLLGLFG